MNVLQSIRSGTKASFDKSKKFLSKLFHNKKTKQFCKASAAVAATGVLVLSSIMGPLAERAHAKPIGLLDGGEIVYHDDGTISGTCYQKFDFAYWTTHTKRPAEFDVTLPNGEKIRTKCIDYESFVPSDGYYKFVGKPDASGLKFKIMVMSNTSPAPYPSKELEGYGHGFPCQRTEQINEDWAPKMWGKLRLHKTSANPALSDGNSCYSLAGAQYDVYDAYNNKYMETLTTDENGYATTKELSVGKYIFKEKKAAKGYAIDYAPRYGVVKVGETVDVEVQDIPQNDPLQISVKKKDAQTGNASPQGAATLEGTEFTLKFYASDSVSGTPARTWVLKTDKDGITGITQAGKIDPQTYFVKGDPFYKNSLGDIVMPLGTLTIQETKAPVGYRLNSEIHTIHVTPDNQEIEDVHTYVAPDHPEQVQRGGVDITKIDRELNKAYEQGDANLENITFEIINKNDHEVVTSMGTCAPDQPCATISTKRQGDKFYAATSNEELPFGHYKIYEKQSNGTYLNDGFSAEFDVKKDKEMVHFTDNASCAKDTVVRGDLKIGKIDRELNRHDNQGAATLEGAEFTIWNKSKNSVVVNNKLIKTNDVACKVYADRMGIAKTVKKALPYGTYLIKETKAPRGYELNEFWTRYIKIRNDGEVYDLTSSKQSADNQVKRGDIRLIKRDDNTQKPLSGVVFRFTSKSTHESHLLVTDQNGEINTSSYYYPHTQDTNANDVAFVKGGDLDATKLKMPYGVWFTGVKDIAAFGRYPNVDCDDNGHCTFKKGQMEVPDGAKPNDKLGALPYDTYTLEELSTPQNKGKKLIKFDVYVTRPRYNIILGTLNNKDQENFITELLGEENTHKVHAVKDCVVHDVINLENLDVNKKYKLEGWLVDAQTGKTYKDAKGNAVTAETVFKPRVTSDRVQLSYKLDASLLQGKKLVSFVRLYNDKDEIIYREEELGDTDQMVEFIAPEEPCCPPCPPAPEPKPQPAPEPQPQPKPEPTPQLPTPQPKPQLPPSPAPQVPVPQVPAPKPAPEPPAPRVPDKKEPPQTPKQPSVKDSRDQIHLPKTNDILVGTLGVVVVACAGVALVAYGVYKKRQKH